MSPTALIARDLRDTETMRLMNRDGYAKWARHEAEAKARREELKRCRNV